eukprot:Clim_evm58s22 gene=Clim_evmTU58s22
MEFREDGDPFNVMLLESANGPFTVFQRILDTNQQMRGSEINPMFGMTISPTSNTNDALERERQQRNQEQWCGVKDDGTQQGIINTPHRPGSSTTSHQQQHGANTGGSAIATPRTQFFRDFNISETPRRQMEQAIASGNLTLGATPGRSTTEPAGSLSDGLNLTTVGDLPDVVSTDIFYHQSNSNGAFPQAGLRGLQTPRGNRIHTQPNSGLITPGSAGFRACSGATGAEESPLIVGNAVDLQSNFLQPPALTGGTDSPDGGRYLSNDNGMIVLPSPRTEMRMHAERAEWQKRERNAELSRQAAELAVHTAREEPGMIGHGVEHGIISGQLPRKKKKHGVTIKSTGSLKNPARPSGIIPNAPGNAGLKTKARAKTKLPKSLVGASASLEKTTKLSGSLDTETEKERKRLEREQLRQAKEAERLAKRQAKEEERRRAKAEREAARQKAREEREAKEAAKRKARERREKELKKQRAKESAKRQVLADLKNRQQLSAAAAAAANHAGLKASGMRPAAVPVHGRSGIPSVLQCHMAMVPGTNKDQAAAALAAAKADALLCQDPSSLPVPKYIPAIDAALQHLPREASTLQEIHLFIQTTWPSREWGSSVIEGLLKNLVEEGRYMIVKETQGYCLNPNRPRGQDATSISPSQNITGGLINETKCWLCKVLGNKDVSHLCGVCNLWENLHFVETMYYKLADDLSTVTEDATKRMMVDACCWLEERLFGADSSFKIEPFRACWLCDLAERGEYKHPIACCPCWRSQDTLRHAKARLTAQATASDDATMSTPKGKEMMARRLCQITRVMANLVKGEPIMGRHIAANRRTSSWAARQRQLVLLQQQQREKAAAEAAARKAQKSGSGSAAKAAAPSAPSSKKKSASKASSGIKNAKNTTAVTPSTSATTAMAKASAAKKSSASPFKASEEKENIAPSTTNDDMDICDDDEDEEDVVMAASLKPLSSLATVPSGRCSMQNVVQQTPVSSQTAVKITDAEKDTSVVKRIDMEDAAVDQAPSDDQSTVATTTETDLASHSDHITATPAITRRSSSRVNGASATVHSDSVAVSHDHQHSTVSKRTTRSALAASKQATGASMATTVSAPNSASVAAQNAGQSPKLSQASTVNLEEDLILNGNGAENDSAVAEGARVE